MSLNLTFFLLLLFSRTKAQFKKRFVRQHGALVGKKWESSLFGGKVVCEK
jgi:hypothetical protein